MKPKNASTGKKKISFAAESRHRLPDGCSVAYDPDLGIFSIKIPLGMGSKECDVLTILSSLGGFKYSSDGLAVNASVAIHKNKFADWCEANDVES